MGLGDELSLFASFVTLDISFLVCYSSLLFPFFFYTRFFLFRVWGFGGTVLMGNGVDGTGWEGSI